MFQNQLNISADNPFDEDKLSRQHEIEKLTKLFDAVGNQMVLAINSPWGTGKSTFLNMWNCCLRKSEYKTIFFNAWENDFIEEPFIAFASAIRDELGEQNKKVAFTQKAQKVGVMLAKQSPKMFVKVLEKHTGFDIREEVDMEGIESFVGKQINSYGENKNSLEKFKEELSNIARKEVEQTGNPIVVFIDELDRCKPTYAITLLERVKHLLNVPNIIFILGIDKEALSNSIKVVYGDGTDINGYLSRFIDMEYMLSEVNKTDYITYLFKKYEFSFYFERISESGYGMTNLWKFREITSKVLSGLGVSLRDMEKIVSNMYIAINLKPIDNILIPTYVFLSVLKKMDTELYLQAKAGRVTLKMMLGKLDKRGTLSDWLNDFNSECIDLYAQLLWIFNDKEGTQEIVLPHKMDIINEDEEREQRCRRIEETIEYYKEYYMKKMENNSNQRNIDTALKSIVDHIQMYDGLSKY